MGVLTRAAGPRPATAALPRGVLSVVQSGTPAVALAAVLAWLPAGPAAAQATAVSPGAGATATAPDAATGTAAGAVGVWRTIDDETGRAKALVRITAQDGVLSGRIEKLFEPPVPNPTCTACTDDRKDQPIQGMTILTDLKPAPDGGAAAWENGLILDPNNGKVYRARAKLVDGGRRLEVRGFIGVALFGRTQTWVRE